MGAVSSSPHGYVEPNPIKLLPEQSVVLFGLLNAKTTLTWGDVVRFKEITFSRLIQNGILPVQLYKLQPDLREWIGLGKCVLLDIKHMGLWKPNPFSDFGASLADIILKRDAVSWPEVLAACNVTVKDLRAWHGLTPDAMRMLHFSLDEWMTLKISAEDIQTLSDKDVYALFGGVTRENILRSIGVFVRKE